MLKADTKIAGNYKKIQKNLQFFLYIKKLQRVPINNQPALMISQEHFFYYFRQNSRGMIPFLI